MLSLCLLASLLLLGVQAHEEFIGTCYKTRTVKPSFEKMVWATSNKPRETKWLLQAFPTLVDQQDNNETCGVGEKAVWADTCSQLHMPYTPYHPSGYTFKLEVEDVEASFTEKWDYMLDNDDVTFDSFLDYNVAYFVSDISNYDDSWEDIGMERIYLKWYQDGKTYYSMISHHGDGSQVHYEIISDVFSGMTDSTVITESEPRAWIRDYHVQDVEAMPIGPRRAVSDLEANIAYYEAIFGSGVANVVTGTGTYHGYQVKYAHVEIDAYQNSTNYIAPTQISFFQREDGASYGEFSVDDFETGLNTVHAEVMINPFCGLDRWFDNHYAIFVQQRYFREVLSNIQYSGFQYVVYRHAGNQYVVYMMEPNGHAVQLVGIPLGEFLVEPNDWSPDWCPVACTTEQTDFVWGDQIWRASLRSDDPVPWLKSTLFVGFGVFTIFFVAACWKKDELMSWKNGGYEVLQN